MSHDQYDKLAWGLVKDEIRRLLKPRDYLAMEDELVEIIRPKERSHFRPNHSLTDQEVKRVRRSIISETNQRLAAFNHRQVRGRMEPQGGMMDIDSFLAWNVTEFVVTDQRDESLRRREKFLELRNLNFAVGKKKIIVDSLSCFVYVNQHTLYRLIQRGAIAKDPIRTLTETIDEWAGYAAMFLMISKHSGRYTGRNVLIPFCGGALLAKIAITIPKNELEVNGQSLRFFDSMLGAALDESPYEPAFAFDKNGQVGCLTLQISTWIPNEIYSLEQEWSHYQIQAFMKKYQQAIQISTKDAFRPSLEKNKKNIEVIGAAQKTFGYDLASIISDPKWATACNW